MSGQVDFSRTAADYAQYRLGYPDELFRRLAGYGIGQVGQRIVDVGTGTGLFARALGRRGASVTGVDRSETLIGEARRLDAADGLSMTYVVASAEATGLPDEAFDVVTAAQCWHWFDRAAAAAEARRIVAPGGRLCIAHFDWIPLPGNVVEATEARIDAFTPGRDKFHTRFAHDQGVYPDWLRDVAVAGFQAIETFSFDTPVRFTHEAWRGRVRASHAVGASLAEPEVRRFDEELGAMLSARFPAEPLEVPHRAFVVLADKPARSRSGDEEPSRGS